MSLRDILRKITPLRASVFAKYRDEQHRQLTEARHQQEADFNRIFQGINDLEGRINELSLRLSNLIELSDSRYEALEEEMLVQRKSIESGQSSVIGEMRKLSISQNVILATGFKTAEAKLDATKQLVYSQGECCRFPDDAAAPPSYSGKTVPKDVEPRGDARVVVSLTSYPARIRDVSKTVGSLIDQTWPADAIQLWLAVEQFPLREAELPVDLLELREKGLEIRWCDDLKAHKKYYYAMLENPNGIVITVDDDIYYDCDTVKTLMEAHKQFPGAVCARRAREIKFRDNGEAAAYVKWPLSSMVHVPSMSLVGTGVGGILYPPHCMDDMLFDKEMLKATCLNSDDLWLKTMQYIAGTKTVLTDDDFKVKAVADTQDTALYVVDQATSRNDKDVWAIRCALRSRYDEVWASGMIAGICRGSNSDLSE